jgi:YVTN family beta-propeller protein
VSEEDKTVTRIDPNRRTTLRTIAVGGAPVAVAVGSSATWLLVAGHTDAGLGRGTPRVGRVDPRENDVVESIPLGIGPVGLGSSAGIAAAAGSVWVMNGDPPLPVSEIDAVNDRLKATFDVGDLSFGFNTGTVGGVRDASGIALGAGSLWIGTAEGIVRIDARSRALTETIPLGGGIPTAIAVDRTGIWVTARPGFRCCPPESVGHGTLTHIDPKTNSVVATIPIGGEPVGVAVGFGSVWVADAGKRTVVRVDPKANAVLTRIDVGAAPRGIAAGGGEIWISA